jgi:hypothetical protein
MTGSEGAAADGLSAPTLRIFGVLARSMADCPSHLSAPVYALPIVSPASDLRRRTVSGSSSAAGDLRALTKYRSMSSSRVCAKWLGAPSAPTCQGAKYGPWGVPATAVLTRAVGDRLMLLQSVLEDGRQVMTAGADSGAHVWRMQRQCRPATLMGVLPGESAAARGGREEIPPRSSPEPQTITGAVSVLRE